MSNMARISVFSEKSFFYTINGGVLAIGRLAGVRAAASVYGPFRLKSEHGCQDGRDANPSISEDERGLTAAYPLPGGLSVEIRWAAMAGGLTERTDKVINLGTVPTTVFGYNALTALSGRYAAYSQANEWTMENQGLWQELDHGVLELTALGARTCLGSTPYLALKNTENGESLAVHVLAEGDWRIRAEVHGSPSASPRLLLCTGPAEAELAYCLAPGECAVLSRTVFLPLPCGTPESGAAVFQRYLLEDAAHRNPKAIPVEFNTWFHSFDRLDEGELLRQLDAACALGCEVFTIDAGWYGRLEGGWYAQVGDWREKLNGAFYGKMGEFADQVRARGMAFGVWIEPERLMKNAPVVVEHPDWFLPDNDGLVYPDLDREEVAQALFDTVSEVIDRYGARWVKIDYNHALGRDPHGSAHMRYLRRFWRIMDDLRAKYPELTLEGCSSGGMRFEAEMQKHYDISFMSDTVNPWDVLRIGEGASLRVLPGRIVRWCCMESGAAIPHYDHDQPFKPILTPKKAVWDDVENTDPDFLLKVCLQGHLSFSGELAGLDDHTRMLIKKAVSFMKRHRALIQRGVFHPLTAFRPIEDRGGWSATYVQGSGQYQSGDAAGILYAYRLESPLDEAVFRLPADAVSGQYVVEDYDTGETFIASARELSGSGVTVGLGCKNSGAMFVLYRK